MSNKHAIPEKRRQVEALRNLQAHFGFASQKRMAMAIKGLSEATLSRALNEHSPHLLSRESRLAIARFLGEQCWDEAELKTVLEQTGWKLTDEEWEEARGQIRRKGENLHGVPFLESDGQFVGREKEIDALVKQLAGPGTPPPRIVVVQGLPGVGKTRLVEHVVRHEQAVREFYRDGIYWLDLEDGNEQKAIADLVWEVGNIDTEGATDPWQLVRRILRNRRVLLILDGVGDALDLTKWVDLVPTGALLVTTRRSDLGAPEYAFYLEPMDLDDSHQLLLRDSKHMDVDEATLTWLAKVVGGLPLALHILSRIAMWENGFARLAQQMRQQLLPVLEISQQKNKSVRATFDLSYERLRPRAQALFRFLSGFPQPFQIEPVAYVLNWETVEVKQAFLELIRAGLVRSIMPGRYSMHHMLHEYARARCNEVDVDLFPVWRERFDSYYLDVAHQAWVAWGRGETREALSLWQTNLPYINITRAFTLAWKEGKSEKVVNFFLWASVYFAVVLERETLISWWEKARQAVCTPEATLHLYTVALDTFLLAGMPRKVIRVARQARELAQKMGKQHQWVLTVLREADAQLMLGQLSTARELIWV